MTTNAVITSRRAALAALAGAAFAPMAIAATSPAVAHPAADGDLLNHFAQRQEAMGQIYADDGEPDDAYYRNHDRASAAEMAMLRLGAESPRGVAAILLAALSHLTDERWLDQSIAADDFGAILARESELDFGPRLVVAAISSLRRMEA